MKKPIEKAPTRGGEEKNQQPESFKGLKQWTEAKTPNFEAENFPEEKEELKEEILALEKQKQQKIEDFKNSLEKLEKSEPTIEDRELPKVKLNVNGDLIVEKEEETLAASLGDLVADHSWGRNYQMDKSVPKNIQKKYLTETTKEDIIDLTNKQILLLKHSSQNSYERKAYKKIEEEKKEGTRKKHAGIIAEKIAQNLLKKTELDCEKANFSLEPSDVELDVEYKIDFLIRKESGGENLRGVHTEKKEEERKKEKKIQKEGVQFTTNLQKLKKKKEQTKRAERKARKDERLENLQDIVVVAVNENFKSIYENWQKNDEKRPGGPLEEMYESDKARLFDEAMKDFIDKEKREEIIREATDYEQSLYWREEEEK